MCVCVCVCEGGAVGGLMLRACGCYYDSVWQLAVSSFGEGLLCC